MCVLVSDKAKRLLKWNMAIHMAMTCAVLNCFTLRDAWGEYICITNEPRNGMAYVTGLLVKQANHWNWQNSYSYATPGRTLPFVQSARRWYGVTHEFFCLARVKPSCCANRLSPTPMPWLTAGLDYSKRKNFITSSLVATAAHAKFVQCALGSLVC